MLAARMDFTEAQIFDTETLEILKCIREGLRDGEHVEKIVRNRLRQLQRKVSLCAIELTSENFFEGSGAKILAERLSKEDRLRSSEKLHTICGADMPTHGPTLAGG